MTTLRINTEIAKTKETIKKVDRMLENYAIIRKLMKGFENNTK